MPDNYKLKKIYLWVNNPEYKNLPSEYQQVEYIESSGTQYIDTLWTPSSNYCKVVANMTFLGGVNSNTAVFFGMTSGGTGYSLHKNPNWQINAGSSGNVNIATYSNGNLNIEYTLNNNAYTVVLGGNTYTGSYSGSIVQSTRPMHIFNFNENGSNTRWAYAMIYSFKIYSDASTLVRDFVPCYRKSDDVIGMYDLVNNQFYTNNGTGTFTKGNDVPDIVEKQVRPKGWKPDASRTILYYNFEQSLNDLSGNNNNPIASSGIGYEQVGGQYVLTNTTNTPYIQLSPSYGDNLTDFTVSFWIYPKKQSGQGDVLLFGNFNSSNPFAGPCIFYMASGPILVRMTGSNNKFPCSLLENTRQHLVFTRINGICYLYLNSNLQLSWEDTTSRNGQEFYIFSRNSANQYFKAIGAKMDKLIYENVGWSDVETTNYYNHTKSNYGYSVTRVQTFDFQNDGDLSWTNNNIGYGDCSIVSGQGWQITRPGQTAMQGGVLPPSSVYGGTLKKRKIWAYKNGNAAVGIANSSQNNAIEYGRDTTKIRVDGTQIGTLSLNGEITMEAIIEDNGHITLNLNSNSYDLGAYGSTYQNLWSSQNLGLELGQRGGTVYIRKVEITTA